MLNMLNAEIMLVSPIQDADDLDQENPGAEVNLYIKNKSVHT